VFSGQPSRRAKKTGLIELETKEFTAEIAESAEKQNK